MGRCLKIVALALLSGGVLLAGLSPKLFAATSSTPDILTNDRAQDADGVDLGSVKPIAKPARDVPKPPPSGNPLWSIPLSVLTASRRPPPQAAEPERPPLALIGAVVGDSEAIAVFVDRTNQKMVRLRQGETHAGWLLSSVLRREVTLKKADRTETIALKSADIPAAAGAPVLPMPTAIGAGPTDNSYVPLVPRSTPKNGESDGL